MTIFHGLDEIRLEHPAFEGQIGGKFHDHVFVGVRLVFVGGIDPDAARDFELQEGMDFVKEDDVDFEGFEESRQIGVQRAEASVGMNGRLSEKNSDIQVRNFIGQR